MLFKLQKISFNRKIKNLIKIVKNHNISINTDSDLNLKRDYYIKYESKIYLVSIEVRESLNSDDYDYILNDNIINYEEGT